MPLPDNNNHTDVDADLEFNLTPQQLPVPPKPRTTKTRVSSHKQATKPFPRVDAVSMGPVACLEAILKCTNVVYINPNAPAGSSSKHGRKPKK